MKRLAYLIIYILAGGLLANHAAAQNAPTQADKDNICLNEIQVENIDMYVDPSWNYGPWVEVYNLSNTAYNLKGCWVSDDPTDLMKVHITQSHPLPAHGFVNLWFDHHDKYCLSQLGLKLSTEGGSFYLSDPYGNLIQSLDYPFPTPRTSYARRTDGSDEWGTTATPTPAATNGEQLFCTEQAPTPLVSKSGGINRSTVQVNAIIPKGYTLRYTTDGTVPTLTNGQTTSAGRFVFKKSTSLRLRLYHENMLPSPVVTETYIIEDFDIPIAAVSIVTDPKNLYSNELGIFVRGVNGRAGLGQTTPCNWNMEWDRPMNIEFFNAKGKQVINQEAGMKRNGAYSRAYTPYGWKVNAEKEYNGANRLNYQFFHHKPYLRHKQLVFRSAGNDNQSRLRDPAVQEIIIRSGLNVDAQSYEPVVHFINGLYRGTINLREPNNKNYVFANYGYDSDEIDFFEMDGDSGYVQKCGDRQAWERLYELSKTAANEESYAEIQTLMDVDEICNYMAVELYMGNDDWPKNNLKGWRPLDENGRFRFILYDIDHAFNLESPFTSFANKKTWTWNPLYNEYNQSIPRITGEVEIVTIFLNLLKNKTFCRHFIDAFCIVAGSVFEPSRCEAIISELCTAVEVIQLQPDNGYGKNVSPWNTGNTMISNYKTRPSLMFSCLESYAPLGLKGTTPVSIQLNSNVPNAQLFVNGQIVPTGSLKGKLYPPVTLRAEAPAGYTFEGWNLLSGNISGTTETIFSEGDDWKYYAKGSLDYTPTWKMTMYNDKNWEVGQAPLGFDNSDVPYRTILDYGTDSSNKRPTYYFRKTIGLEEAPAESDVIQFTYYVDDGLVLYINGTEAFRSNMPDGTVNYDTFSKGLSANPDVGTVTLPSSLFRKGDNLLAAEVHNYSKTSSDIYWDAALRIRRSLSIGEGMIGNEPQLELPDGTEMNLQACFVPIEASQTEMAPVVINELSAANSMYVNDYFKKADWVELYNRTDRALNLDGLYISDDISKPTKYKISSEGSDASTIIPAHGYRIIWCDDKEPLNQLHAPFKLSDTDQSLVLLSAADLSWQDTLIYCVHTGYESVGRFPDGTSHLYKMSRPTIDKQNTMTMLTTGWQPAPIENPGDDTSIEETMASRDGGMSIVPRRGELLIHSEDETLVSLQIFTLSGQMVMGTDLHMEDGRARVDIRLLAPGTYVARLTGCDGGQCATKFMQR